MVASALGKYYNFQLEKKQRGTLCSILNVITHINSDKVNTGQIPVYTASGTKLEMQVLI